MKERGSPVMCSRLVRKADKVRAKFMSSLPKVNRELTPREQAEARMKTAMDRVKKEGLSG